MKQYIEECLEEFSEEITKKLKTPGAHDMFKVNEEERELSKIKAEVSHHIVAKLLYVSKRARLENRAGGIVPMYKSV